MKRYVLAHWRGEQSLARSVLINGMLGYLALILIFVGLNQFTPGAVGLALLIAWFCLAFVGIARSAIRIFRSPGSTLLAKSFSVAVIALVLAAVLLTARDLSLLLGHVNR